MTQNRRKWWVRKVTRKQYEFILESVEAGRPVGLVAGELGLPFKTVKRLSRPYQREYLRAKASGKMISQAERDRLNRISMEIKRQKRAQNLSLKSTSAPAPKKPWWKFW